MPQSRRPKKRVASKKRTSKKRDSSMSASKNPRRATTSKRSSAKLPVSKSAKKKQSKLGKKIVKSLSKSKKKVTSKLTKVGKKQGKKLGSKLGKAIGNVLKNRKTAFGSSKPFTVKSIRTGRKDRKLADIFANIERHAEDFNAMKESGEYFGFSIYGNHSWQVFANVKDLIKRIQSYKSIQQLQSRGGKKFDELARNIKIIRFKGTPKKWARDKETEWNKAQDVKRAKAKENAAIRKENKQLRKEVKKLRSEKRAQRSHKKRNVKRKR